MGQHTKAVGTVGITVVAVVLAAAVLGVAGGQTTGIEECRTIDQSGTYELSSTTDGSDVDSCLRISADDVVLRDNGETVDGGRADQAKWIDDDHLTFHRSTDGFVLETDGENLTRLNGDWLRPGERRPVEPGDEIEVSGFLRLSVEE
jgi:FlaG/FlaF family flagellin (archaellin)